MNFNSINNLGINNNSSNYEEEDIFTSTDSIFQTIFEENTFSYSRGLRRFNRRENLQNILNRIYPSRINILRSERNILNDDETYDDTFANKIKYIDFRDFPINVEWREVENEKSEAYEIMKSHGYFGMVFFSIFHKNDIQITDVILKKKIINLLICIDHGDSIFHKTKISDIMEKFPSLDKIKFAIEKGLYNKRDILCIMFMITIYETYLRKNENPPYKLLRNTLIPLAISFYRKIPFSELSLIIRFLKEQGHLIRWIFELCDYKRKNFIDYYNKLYKNYSELYDYLNMTHFIN